MDNYREIYKVIHVLYPERLIINSKPFLSKLIERTSTPFIGWNCLTMALKYFDSEQAVSVLYEYIKKENIPEVLEWFFEPMTRHTLKFEVWNASNPEHPRTYLDRNLSTTTAQKFIELLFHIFLRKNECDHIYAFNLSRLMCIQASYVPVSLRSVLPEIEKRTLELRQKTELKFYDFETSIKLHS